MIPHDFLTLHAAKMVEYLIAIAYLLLFIPFWRFVTARPQPAFAREHVRVPRMAPLSEWFAMVEGLFYHPGHAWVRVDGPQAATVGIDDFAGRLVGRPSAIRLPSIGDRLVQGEPAWALVADGKAVQMLSPVTGTVTAVNDNALANPDLAHAKPYDDGWLLKVKSPSIAGSLKQLLTGQLAKRWMEDVATALRGGMRPALGMVYEDGGAVVDGLAKALDADAWDSVARQFLLTNDIPAPAGALDFRGGQNA